MPSRSLIYWFDTKSYLQDFYRIMSWTLGTCRYRGCFVIMFVCNFLLWFHHQHEFWINPDQHRVHFATNYTLPPFQHTDSVWNMNQYTQFKNFLSSWPSNRPKAAVYFLIGMRHSKLKTALQSLDKYFNDHFHYPVIIFHELDNRKHLLNVTSWSKSYIVFQEITFSLPSFIPHKFEHKNCDFNTTLGYRHMCRFHSKLVYEQPIMRLIDYAWRLDDDSELRSSINVDLFLYMQQNDIEYGYQVVTLDNAQCVAGLWDAARQYVKNKNIHAEVFHQWENRWMFYNNFELSKVSFWLSQQYQGYIEYIDQLGGIYYSRWGDAPIKSIGVSMFMPKRKIHSFSFISYRHSGFWNPWNPPAIRYYLHTIDSLALLQKLIKIKFSVKE